MDWIHPRRPLYEDVGYSWHVDTEAYSTGDANANANANGDSVGVAFDGGRSSSLSGGFWQYFMYFARKGVRDPAARLAPSGRHPHASEGDAEKQHAYLDDESFLFRMDLAI